MVVFRGRQSLVDDDFEGSQLPRLTTFGCQGCGAFLQGVRKRRCFIVEGKVED